MDYTSYRYMSHLSIIKELSRNPAYISELSVINYQQLMVTAEKDSRYIEDINNKPYNVRLASISTFGGIKFLTNASNLLKIKACEHDGENIDYIDFPTSAMMITALESDETSIKYMNYITQEVKEYILSTPDDIFLSSELKVIRDMLLEDKTKSINPKSILRDFKISDHHDEESEIDIPVSETVKKPLDLKNMTEDEIILAIMKDYSDIQYIDKPSYVLQLLVLTSSYQGIKYINNPDYEICKLSCEENYNSLKYIDNHTDELIEIAINNSPYAVRLVKNISEKMSLLAVSKDGDVIQYLTNPSKEVKQLAFQTSPECVEHINYPTAEMITYAAKNSYNALLFLENPSKQSIIESITNFGETIKYVEFPTDEMKWLALHRGSDNIEYIEDPDDDMIIYVIKESFDNIKLINNLSLKHITLATEEIKKQLTKLIKSNIGLTTEDKKDDKYIDYLLEIKNNKVIKNEK